MSEDKTLTKIPHFDGYYDHWSELIENLLREKGLWNLVEIGFEEPRAGTNLTEAQRAQLEDARIKDHKSSIICSKQLIELSLNKSWIVAQSRSFGTQ